MKPEYQEYWVNKGVCLLILGRYEKAIYAYDKAL
ncbi:MULTISPECIES: tetratricopeptide repeat protein [unclassified Okeania]|nr:tetratricopeptide repeat protein [Okeania sp. SIO1H4]NET21601.1 tetratricopeptide repeat protein [Okeania sp. SIO1H5]NET91691.1 tetratricopeptide repeat protein [Okeania sp. SIO1H2]